MKISIDTNALKTRYENYIIYDVDYLLRNLEREFELLASYREGRNHIDREVIDVLLKELKEKYREEK